MRKLATLMGAAAVVGLMALASPALAQTTVTSFAPSTNNAPGVWFENDVRTGGTASIADLTGLGGDLETAQPLPIGAAKLTTDFTNAAKAEVGVLNDYGMPDNIFSTLSIMYSYHKATNAGQNASAAPSLKLTFFNAACVDVTSGGDCFAALVYEPTWNGSNGPGVASIPATDQWTAASIDGATGVFWTTGGFGFGNSFGGAPFKTLAGWLAESSSDFGGATLFQVSIGVGSFNQGQIGYFDDVTIAGTNADASYDFDPAPSFETLGECISTLIADECSGLSGRARANCNHEQQMTCFDIFGIQ